MTSILKQIPWALQKQTTWEECECLCGERPTQRLKEDAHPTREGVDPTSLVLTFQHSDLVPNPLLLSDLCFCPWAGHRIARGCSSSQRDVSWHELSWGSPRDSIQLPKAPRETAQWRGLGGGSSVYFRGLLGRVLVWRRALHLAEFGTNVWLKPYTIKLIEQL